MGTNSCDQWNNSRCEGTAFCPPRCPRFIDRTGTPIHIRLAEYEDYHGVVTMYDEIEIDQTMGLPPLTRTKIEEWVRMLYKQGWNLVATCDDRVIGHVGVTPSDSSEPQFVIFIRPAYHDRGIGTELLKHVVAYAADRGHEGLTLDVSRENRRAITVYKNVDFDVIESRTSELTMALPLSDSKIDRVQVPPAEVSQE